MHTGLLASRTNFRRQAVPARWRDNAHGRKVFHHQVGRDMLGQEVCHVFLAFDFFHEYLALANAILHPQILHVQVPDLAEPLSVDYGQRC